MAKCKSANKSFWTAFKTYFSFKDKKICTPVRLTTDKTGEWMNDEDCANTYVCPVHHPPACPLPTQSTPLHPFYAIHSRWILASSLQGLGHILCRPFRSFLMLYYGFACFSICCLPNPVCSHFTATIILSVPLLIRLLHCSFMYSCFPLHSLTASSAPLPTIIIVYSFNSFCVLRPVGQRHSLAMQCKRNYSFGIL